MVKNLPGLGLIAAIVGVAFLINDFQPAVSPLALCVAFGFAVANFGRWPSFAAAGTGLASKKLMRIGVALLGAQVSVVSLKAIGFKGVLTVILVVTFTIFGILALSKVFKMSGELGLLIGVGFGVCGATAVAAIRPQTRATEEETSYAIALISLCGTLSIFTLPFTVPLGFGNHISLFTLLAVFTSFLMSIYNMAMTPTQDNPALKYMPYIFPFMLLFIFNGLPSALTWYYTVSNVITLLMQLVIQKVIIDHDKILAEIDVKRKTPKKKSNWQSKYEQMLDAQKKVQTLKDKTKK